METYNPLSTSVDCRWGMWETWSPCTKTCGGIRTSKREVNQEAQNGGTECVGEKTKEEDCNAPGCPRKNCPILVATLAKIKVLLNVQGDTYNR